jgi:S-adenosylmethionine decarboxylase
MEKAIRDRMATLPTLQHVRDEAAGSAAKAERDNPRVAFHVVTNSQAETPDHLVERDGLRFAGTHLIIDLWHASHLDTIEVVEMALRESVAAAGATLLKLDLHHFAPNGGITGVAVLAESHISIHTWPELAYAAVDVFMCGGADPHKAIEVLKRSFIPQMLTVSEHRRGVML